MLAPGSMPRKHKLDPLHKNTELLFVGVHEVLFRDLLHFLAASGYRREVREKMPKKIYEIYEVITKINCGAWH